MDEEGGYGEVGHHLLFSNAFLLNGQLLQEMGHQERHVAIESFLRLLWRLLGASEIEKRRSDALCGLIIIPGSED